MTEPTPRVILITGASSGIGRSCAIALSQAFPSSLDPEPLVLVLSGRRQAELEITANGCRDGTITEICAGDVGKDEDVETMFEIVKRKYGRIDVVFNVGVWDNIQAKSRTQGLICSTLYLLRKQI
jgi:NADP-dependent 3-hydroxy acid dehydrogenase YdfG